MFDFIYTVPAWVPSAVICGVLALLALIAYLAGKAQGYTSDDYRRARMRARQRRRRR